MPVVVDHDDHEEPRRRELLALSQLRRDLERRAPAIGPLRSALVEVTPEAVVRELRELIEALDRRVPRVEQVGEDAIARDAAMLRATAVNRLAEITNQQAPAEAASDRQPTSASTGRGTARRVRRLRPMSCP